MRRYLILILLTISLILCASSLFLSFQRLTAGRSDAYSGPSTDKLWHVMAVLPSPHEAHIEQLYHALREAGAESSLAIEFRFPRDDVIQPPELEKYLEIAYMAELDAVLLYVTDDECLTPYIDKLELAGIHVITLEFDAPRSRRTAYIGTSGYEVGRQAGELTISTGRPEIKAVFLTGGYAADTSSRWNSVYYGIKTEMSSHADFSIVPPARFEEAGSGIESVARRILILLPQTNVIFCGDESSTIAASRVVKEFNADIDVIGFGPREFIEREIGQKMIFGAVVYDPSRTAQLAVTTLEALQQGRYIANLVYTQTETFRSSPLERATR